MSKKSKPKRKRKPMFQTTTLTVAQLRRKFGIQDQDVVDLRPYEEQLRKTFKEHIRAAHDYHRSRR